MLQNKTNKNQKTVKKHIGISIKTLSIFLLLLASLNLNAEIINVGRFKVEIKQLNQFQLEISYSPYDRFHEICFTESRYQRLDNPLGPRPNWTNIECEMNSTLKKAKQLAKNNRFHAIIDARDTKEWDLLEVMDQWVEAYISMHHLQEFWTTNHLKMKTYCKENFDTLWFMIKDPDVSNYCRFARNNNFLQKDIKQILIDNTKEIPTAIEKKLNVDKQFNEHTLLVVHASKEFDSGQMAKHSIDVLVKTFKDKNLPVIYLMHDDQYEDFYWYTEDKNPTYAIKSAGGEHNLKLATPEVTIVGGFFGDYDTAAGCHFKAMADTITRHFLYSSSTIKINLPLDAIYFYDIDISSRNNWLTNSTIPKEIVEQIHSTFFFTDGDNDSNFGLADHDRFTGIISADEYLFEYYIDDKLIYTFGNGSKKVEFRFFR